MPDPADVAAAPPILPGPVTTSAEAEVAAVPPSVVEAAPMRASRGPEMHAPSGSPPLTAPDALSSAAPNAAPTFGSTAAPTAGSSAGSTVAPERPERPERLTVPGMEQPPPDEKAKNRRTLQRRRLVMLLAFVLLAILVLLVGQVIRKDNTERITGTPVASALPGVQPGAGEATTAPTGDAGRATAGATKAETTQDTADTTPAQAGAAAEAFNFAGGYGPVLGTSGTLRRFKVAVEKPMGNGGGFSMEVDRTLADPRSWIAARQFRLQRVPRTAASEFTVYLATAKTSEKMCAAGGLRTEGYTSCRLPGQVIINWDRWQDAVPDYDAPLATYRAYAINHEVGHQLGHGHEACPGKGKPAPVMMQQTYGLKGCVANSWPYINGERYEGEATD